MRFQSSSSSCEETGVFETVEGVVAWLMAMALFAFYWWVDSLEADAGGVRLSFYAFSAEVAPLVKLWTEHLCWVSRHRLASTFLSTYAAGIWSIDDVALSFCWRRWNEGRSFLLFHLSRSFGLVRPGFCFCLVWFLVWLWLCLVVGVACVLCCLCFASFFWIPGLTWFAQDQKEWQLSFLRFFEANVKNFGFETFAHHIVLFYLFNYCIHRHSCRRQWRSHVWITWKIILLHHMWNCTERYEI